MTHFHVELDLICPSNWDEDSVLKYVKRLTSSPQEWDTIKITTLEPLTK